jgi:hypothetical protein
MRARIALAVGLAVAALAVAPSAHAAVSSVAPASQWARAGAALQVTAVGRGPAAFLLSADRRRSRTDVRLGTRRLRGRTRLRLRVPRNVRLGAMYLLACSPAARRGRPPSCRAARRRLAVTPRPRPQRVGPRADAARTASAQMGREGGSVAATGADGTTYTLTLPAGALLDPTTITLTPLSAIGGMPMRARLARAVQIGPSGRRLLKAATLSIAAPRLPARTQLTAFGFKPDGREFHLVPPTLGAGQVTLPVFELKGLGIATTTAAARYVFSRSRFPTAMGDQLQQVVAVPRAPRGVRAGAAQFPPGDPRNPLEAQVMAMALSIQVTAVSNIDLAVFEYVVWDRLAAASVLGPALRSQLAAVFRGNMLAQISLARASCVGNRDIAQMGRLLRYRDYLFTSLATLVIPDVRFDIDRALERCLRFDLVYEVSIQGVNGYNEAVTAQVKSTLPIRMTGLGDTSSFFGQAPLELVAYSVGPESCWTHTWNVTPKDPFVLRRMRVGILRELGAERTPPTIDVTFNLGSLDEQVTHTCDGDPNSSYTDQQHAYDGAAAALLGGAAGSDFSLSWMGSGGSGEYASQSFTRSAQTDGSYTGTFTFKLRHTPA